MHQFVKTGSFLIIAALTAGCTSRTNVDSPIIRGESVVNGERASASVDGLSRAHWPSVDVSIVRAPTEHQPTYVNVWRVAETDPRQTGTYPSVDTVLQNHRDDAGQAAEAALAYPHAAWLLLIAPFKMIAHDHPWDTITTHHTYTRAPD